MKKNKKISFDILDTNYDKLVNLTSTYNCKLGPLINNIVSLLLDIPDDVRAQLIDVCQKDIVRTNMELENATGFGQNELENHKKHMLELARLFNNGKTVELTDEDPNKLTKYNVKDGYLLVPRNWICLNPEEEGKYKYAGVIECRNHIKYGIPHFFFYTNERLPKDYDEQQLIDMACTKWPEFKEKVVDQQVALINDPERPGLYLNSKEHLASPVIGYFALLRDDDPLFDDEPPMGAMIVSTKK